MDKQYNITLTEKQLKRIIELAKKGTMSQSDRDLIEFLEYVKNNRIEKRDTAYWMDEHTLDEIPF